MSRRKRRVLPWIFALVALLAIAVCIGCGIYLYEYFRGDALYQALSDQPNELTHVVVEPVRKPEVPQPVEDDATSAPEEPEIREIELCVDFDALHEVNSEIYAWIKVLGTGVDYPVLQSETSDLYYNNHTPDGEYYFGGSIFTQKSYNDRSFDAPMTVIYGHNIRDDDKMFTQLNNFADADFFDAHEWFEIYTPEQVYRYRIFATYPYSRRHLLEYHDFSDPEVFDAFFAELPTEDPLYTHTREEFLPSVGDRVVTLSTCYRKNKYQRYLVQGVLEEVLHVVQAEND